MEGQQGVAALAGLQAAGERLALPSRRSRDVEVERVQELGQRGEEQLVAATSDQPVGRQGAVGSPPGEV